MRNVLTLIILAFFFPLEAETVTFIKMRSGLEGTSKVEFKLDINKSILNKASNFYDTKKQYNLGVFSIPSSKTEGSIKSLNSLVQKISQLKSDLPIKPHETFYILEGKKVNQGLPIFKTLSKVFVELQNLPWIQEEGIFISTDLKRKSTLKDRKIILQESFDIKFFCKSSTRPTYCLDKKYGIIYVD